MRQQQERQKNHITTTTTMRQHSHHHHRINNNSSVMFRSFSCSLLLILLLLFASTSSALDKLSSTNNSPTESSSSPSSFLSSPLQPLLLTPEDTTVYQTTSFLLPTGEIADTLCTIDDLERANDMQLHVIFEELVSTNFFQHFIVDLEHKCPLSKWSSSTDDKHATKQKEEEPTTKKATVEEVEDDDDEFQCTGGAEELDEDAEPLCGVDTGGSDDDFLGVGGGFGAGSGFGGGTAASSSEKKDDSGPVTSNVLQTLSQQGFTSKPQRDTFAWNQQTDMIVQEDETPCDDKNIASTEGGGAQDAADVLKVPDSFWMDMCSKINEGDGTKLVNLALNPERNTYYNGTHIWKAIYEENCITSADSCLEERVLYRLLSGMHTSTTLSIAQNYYPPSKRHNRTSYEPNPQYFMDKFQHHPDHIRNLHFSYVVMLRAIKKASKYLYNYEISSGNVVEDEASRILLKRLLDTSILRSCSNVFSAFDESVMFQEDDHASNVLLQQSFKGVFHNISSILDCVQCQQCKLHGKLTMLGYGTALKVLFVKDPQNLVLEPNEVVALINTAARLSESLMQVRELTTMYWQSERQKVSELEAATEASKSAVDVSSSSFDSLDLLDITIGLIATLGRSEMISVEREKELIDMALSRNPELLIMGKHYHKDPQRFVELTKNLGLLGTDIVPIQPPDAIVIGSGLAGLAASLNILDRGGTVVIMEKEHLLGGNSNKASSGINGCCPNNDAYNDTLEAFRNDTIRSAGEVADLDLINVLISKSEQAVLWLKNRAHVDLSLLAQLGGHSAKRTHRPSNGMAGAEIIYHLQKEVRSYEKTGRLKIMVDTKVKELLTEDDGGKVVGVSCENTKDGTVQEVRADNVILATGGFASDRSSGSYLDKYRPELMSFPATAGAFSTGDGIGLATSLGAAIRDMDKVQIHPTGWVDPTDPTNPTKILAAELMRGVGGVLIDESGKRFCNELGTRAYVTNQMLKHDDEFAKTGTWNRSTEVPTFFLVLSSSAAADAQKHVDLYTHKGLLTRVEGVAALAKHMGMNSKTITTTLTEYQSAASVGVDSFGKTSFRGVPADDLDTEVFFVGKVSPVLHYCMGGIKIDTEGNVIKEDGTTIKGLHAAGEVTGGVHGNNRLGGNSLLECTVFGSLVGQKIPIKPEGTYRLVIGKETDKGPSKASKSSGKAKELPKINLDELAKHNTEDDLWVALHGVVYDFTEFAHEHPAGFESIFELAGTDGTETFDAVHNLGMLDDFEEDKRGVLVG